MTNNLNQFDTNKLAPEGVYKSILYQRSLLGVGTTPVDWSYDKYFNSSSKNILRISMDDMQLHPASLQDNVMRTAGITYNTENVSIQPYLIEVPQSKFIQNNINEVVPQVITEMNRFLDMLCYKNLIVVSKAGTTINWTNPSDFVQWAIRIASHADSGNIRKHLIIPMEVRAALLGVVAQPDHSSWLSTLMGRLSEMNTDVITSAVADRVLLVQAPFVAEYNGIEPHLFASGVDERKHENWAQFAMSTTDFKVRQGGALMSYEVANVPKTIEVEIAPVAVMASTSVRAAEGEPAQAGNNKDKDKK